MTDALPTAEMYGKVKACDGWVILPRSGACPLGKTACTSQVGADCPFFGGFRWREHVALCSEAEGADPVMRDWRRERHAERQMGGR